MSKHREDDTDPQLRSSVAAASPRARQDGPPGGPCDGHGGWDPKGPEHEVSDRAFESILGWIGRMTEQQLLRVQCKVAARIERLLDL